MLFLIIYSFLFLNFTVVILLKICVNSDIIIKYYYHKCNIINEKKKL